MDSNLSGNVNVFITRPYLELDEQAFRAFDNELERLIDRVHSARVLEVHVELHSSLKRLQEIFESEARILGRSRGKEDYEHLKERVHAFYNRLAFPFIKVEEPRPLAEVAVRCYYALGATLNSLENVTGYRFDYGLAYHNSGIALARFGDVGRAVILIELADIEDVRIGHVGGEASSALEVLMRSAWSICDDIARGSKLSLSPTPTLVQFLNSSEQYRTLDIILRYAKRIQDNRGHLVKDALERNLNSIAKLTEAYLRRIRPPKGKSELVSLVQNNFDTKSYAWRREWQEWKDSVHTDYTSPADDSKLTDILNDTKTSYEGRMFEMLCLTRNFTSHLFNDESIMFNQGKYERIFEMCLVAFLYTLEQIKP